MSNNYYCNKKRFSNELLEFLGLPNKPYYLTYVYNTFFDKIKNLKSYNSYKLTDDIKTMLHLDYGTYVRVSSIKRKIKEHHVKSSEVPNGIKCLNSTNMGIIVNEICV